MLITDSRLRYDDVVPGVLRHIGCATPPPTANESRDDVDDRHHSQRLKLYPLSL
jgi:hypothetical protein